MKATNNVPRLSMSRLPAYLLLALVCLGITACAESYVVLMDNDDGTVGKIQVTTDNGTTFLENNREGALLTGEAGKIFPVTEERINKDFGQALSATPKKPISFYLYFEEGGTRLTEASTADIPKIIEEIRQHPAADISVIGHTDTLGDEDDNTLLSLERAKMVASLLSEAKLDMDKVRVESHGEKNLLILTPDNTAEPRNRRVEVTVR